jgi:hypothetical protein
LKRQDSLPVSMNSQRWFGRSGALLSSWRRRRQLITSLLPAAWHVMIDDPAFAEVVLDGMVHKAHRLDLEDQSMRRSGSFAEIIDEIQRA